jgi:hypothetical protein
MEEARDKAASAAASEVVSEAGPSRARPANIAKANTETEKTLNARARTGKGVELTAPGGNKHVVSLTTYRIYTRAHQHLRPQNSLRRLCVLCPSPNRRRMTRNFSKK